MISIEQAWELIDEHVTQLARERCAVAKSVGRVLAEDVVSVTDLPPFDQSAMDGVVVHAKDIASASETSPITLPVLGEIPAGRHDTWPSLETGGVARIFTGAPVPAGEVTMVPRELIVRDGDSCTFVEPAPIGGNIRRRGEEISAGKIVLTAGSRMTAGTSAAASMAGIAEVIVRRRPRVAVITTGDEVVAPGAALEPGQVYDANQAFLSAWAEEEGVEIVFCQHIADSEDALQAAIEEAADLADVLVTTGGVSVGKHDHVLSSADNAGFTQRFWKVAQKPGKPLYFATRESVALLGLPGNPGAVFANAYAFLDRIIDRMEGASSARPHLESGALTSAQRARPERGQWLRVVAASDDSGVVRLSSLDGQGSHMLGNLAAANAVAWIPAGVDSAESGAQLKYFRLLSGLSQEASRYADRY